VKGEIKMVNVQLRYRQGLELVLKGITVSVAGGERVGVVGRTGAGKSSLMLALFRLVEVAAGSIHIDGINIAHMGLDDLRARLSIIPQDPTLFEGTIRTNLDPLGTANEEELWAVLDAVAQKAFVQSQPQGLDAPVASGGENLSVGQRQLLCMARALLKRNRVLVLDEATAAVDFETDALIQRTLRLAFVGVTVLTIAHRIQTILDYDKIMVLDQGYLAEFDTPSNLIGKKGSLFRALVEESGIKSDTISASVSANDAQK